jgi:hypothetical protein
MSDKQRELLQKFGITNATLSNKQAQQIISAQFGRIKKNLCTLKQARLLAKHGYDTSNITISQASKLIDAIASNGWTRGNGPQFDQP